MLRNYDTEHDFWHVPQKVVKCYFVPLPRFSYIYWLINFNNFFYVYCKGKTSLFFICSFYCCLVKEGWTLKVVQQFAIWGLVVVTVL